MKIALMMEFSQAPKNPIVLKQLQGVAAAQGHEVFNVGMDGENDHRLTYIHLGICAALMLNSGAADFVVSGCGTGQGAMMSLNAWPGVYCGYCIEPTDAFLFAQVNNGNALALPYAKGFGWGGEINVRYIFEKAFDGERGQGYPASGRQSQQTNAGILAAVKRGAAKDLVEGLQSIDPELVKHAVSGERFQKAFFDNAKDEKLRAYVSSVLGR
jgi:ribose 5-phosphate isomerase B